MGTLFACWLFAGSPSNASPSSSSKLLIILARPTGFEPVTSAFGGQLRGPSAACAISLTSCPDSEERTGIRFEKERVYGYSGGAKPLPGRPLAPATAPIRGSRR
jgi:hypothetical protein